MDVSNQMILALDIGGTKLAAGVASADEFRQTGKLHRVHKEPIPGQGRPQQVLMRVQQILPELMGGATLRPARCGISIGGPLDHQAGVVINFPHLPGWKNIPLAELISDITGAAAWLDNDANLGALAEHRWGAGRGCAQMVYITVSTGIGGGVIVNNALVHGVRSAAGELGHITVATDGFLCACGNRGCLEAMASGTAIARRARLAVELNPSAGAELLALAGGHPAQITAEHVVRAARLADPLALGLWEETAEYLAVGIGSIIHLLAPERVILGGGVAQAGGFLLEPVRRRLAGHVFYVPLDQIQVLQAGLGHDSALTGAATLALDAGM